MEGNSTPVGIVETTNVDGWGNLLTGIGKKEYDKRLSTKFDTPELLSFDELTAIFRAEGLGSRIVTVPAGDMVRQWFDVVGDPEGLVNMKLDELFAKPIIEEALVWDRLFGGSIVLMYIDDGQTLDKEVNIEKIKNIVGFQVYDRNDVTWTGQDLYQDPEDPRFGQVQVYTVMNITTGRTFRVHETRVLRFDGSIIPARIRACQNGWGDPVLYKIYDRLRGLGEGYVGSEHIIQDFVTDVMKIKNLDNLISSEKGYEKILKRLQALDMTKHLMNTKLLDEGETYERIVSSGSTGTSDILNQLIDAVISGCGIPKVKLFGEQAKGLGSEAAGNIRLYYDDIAAEQLRKLKKPFERLVKYVFRSHEYDFRGVEPEKWSIKMRPLWQPSDQEIVNTKKTMAEIDNIYYQMGLPESVIFLNRFAGDYSIETVLDEELIAYYENQAEMLGRIAEPETETETETKIGEMETETETETGIEE